MDIRQPTNVFSICVKTPLPTTRSIVCVVLTTRGPPKLQGAFSFIFFLLFFWQNTTFGSVRTLNVSHLNNPGIFSLKPLNRNPPWPNVLTFTQYESWFEPTKSMQRAASDGTPTLA